jgi:hypothetical protein
MAGMAGVAVVMKYGNAPWRTCLVLNGCAARPFIRYDFHNFHGGKTIRMKACGGYGVFTPRELSFVFLQVEPRAEIFFKPEKGWDHAIHKPSR